MRLKLPLPFNRIMLAGVLWVSLALWLTIRARRNVDCDSALQLWVSASLWLHAINYLGFMLMMAHVLPLGAFFIGGSSRSWLECMALFPCLFLGMVEGLCVLVRLFLVRSFSSHMVFVSTFRFAIYRLARG